MKKVIKIISIVCIILIGVIALICYIIESKYGFIDKEEVIKTYTNNKDVFNELSNYAIENPKNISIEEEKIANVDISDTKTKDDFIYLLNKLKYVRVAEDDYTVEFIRQATIGYGQGILYLKNGNKASDLPFMKDLEHIEGNWYYFEAGE